MKHAYLLNKELTELDINENYQQTALDIACDVHDVKKDYRNLLIGLKSYFDSEQESCMTMEAILIIVTNYARTIIREHHLEILITTDNQSQLRSKQHYYLVSILSNLINNSIDALENQLGGYIHIQTWDTPNKTWVTISDNGPGVSEDERDLIFNAGYSTKFYERTGDIYRGIGLLHVRTMLREKFNGDIQLDHNKRPGASFTLWITKDEGEN